MEKSGKEVSTTSRNKEVVYRFELPDGTSLSATSQKDPAVVRFTPDFVAGRNKVSSP